MTEPTVVKQTPQPTTGSATTKSKYKYKGKRYTLEQMLRDPAKRSTLDASLLSPEQQAARKTRLQTERDDANPLYNPNAQLSGSALARAARQMAGLELDPQISAINRETQQAQTQGAELERRAGDYYRQVAGDQLQGSAMIQAIGDRLQGRLGEIGAGTNAAMDATQQAEQQRQAQDAQVRGEGLDGGAGANVAAQIAQQRSAAQTQQQVATQQAAEQNAAAERLAAQSAINTGQRGGEETGQIRNRVGTALTELRGKRSDLEGQRGSLTTKYLTDMRQKSFENTLLGKEFGLKVATAEADAAAAAADSKTKEDSARQEFIAKYGVSPEKWRSMSPEERLQWKAKWDKAGKNAPKGSTTDHYGYDQSEWDAMTPEQRRAAKAKWDKAGKSSKPDKESDKSNEIQAQILTGQDYFGRVLGDHPQWTREQMIAHARKTHPETYGALNIAVMNAAIDLAAHGRIRKGSRDQLETIGVSVDANGQLA